MIKSVNGAFIISANEVWRPGKYESEKAARIAQRFLDEELLDLQKIANKQLSVDDRVITVDMLKKAVRWPKAPVSECWSCGKKLWGNGRYFKVVVSLDGVNRYLHHPCAERLEEHDLTS